MNRYYVCCRVRRAGSSLAEQEVGSGPRRWSLVCQVPAAQATSEAGGGQVEEGPPCGPHAKKKEHACPSYYY